MGWVVYFFLLSVITIIPAAKIAKKLQRQCLMAVHEADKSGGSQHRTDEADKADDD